MEPFKNIFDEIAVKKISKEIKQVYKSFNTKAFEKEVLESLDELELKNRVRLISFTLKKYLTSNYKKNIKILISILSHEDFDQSNDWHDENNKGISGFITWPLTQFVEDYGLEDLKTSMEALYIMTKRFTAEFAIRPFLEIYGEEIYAQYLNIWIKDECRHIRRLVSEGTRPNLPWGKKVSWISRNPKYNIYLLDQLKDDPEEYVRRSVANHLNDISRIDKKLMLRTLSKWNLDNPHIKWIIRHSTRSLLKMGDSKALRLNGFATSPKVKVTKFKFSPKKLKEGESFKFKFELENISNKELNLLIDYIIHYPKKNGKLSPKVFRLKTVKLKKGEKILIEKEVYFKKVTTRIHYLGQHLFELKICDQVFINHKFKLVD